MDLLIETVDGHSLTVSQTGLASGIGGVAWDCGLVLSRLLLEPRFLDLLRVRLAEKAGCCADSEFSSMTALELGSGTGLVGMQLAMLGFKSVLTDLPGVMPQLAVNLAQNAHLLSGASVLADIFVWGQETPSQHFPLQLLVMSDCLYAFEYAELLSQSLRDIFAWDAGGHSPLVLQVYEDRAPNLRDEFLAGVADFLSWEDVPLTDFMAADDLPPDVHLMFLFRRQD